MGTMKVRILTIHDLLTMANGQVSEAVFYACISTLLRTADGRGLVAQIENQARVDSVIADIITRAEK